MKATQIDVHATIKEATSLLENEKDIPPAFRSVFKVLILLVKIFADRSTLNSRNSSKPPSSDPNREKKKKVNGKRNPGGQKGHTGKTLCRVDDPDEVEEIKIDRRSLPEGQYADVGYEARQVFDVIVSRHVTEYRAQILEDMQGNRFVAPFPKELTRPAQYGIHTKVNAVYMSQYQLLPYERIKDHFESQMDIPLSVGSIYNFNKSAYERLEGFEQWLIQELINSDLNHADETGINIDGKRHWLHCISNSSLTYLYSHNLRGTTAMESGGVIPLFKGVLCHDHWKPYYSYTCIHSLCNAHHLRELERASEQDNQKWAKEMQQLLVKINTAVEQAGGKLSPEESKKFWKIYRKIIQEGELECPAPIRAEGDKKRGRLKRSKARNLLERLKDFEEDVLRFMDNELVPFTNNQGERDLRMTKVHQKIAGCFRSSEGSKFFSRIRSYISTCSKQGVSANEALSLLFLGKDPDFMTVDADNSSNYLDCAE
ncbi:MAG: IS66 family transposase [Spirochaetales bacterium]|nr:IS66 family transposase [Spirochaetales bacterium]